MTTCAPRVQGWLAWLMTLLRQLRDASNSEAATVQQKAAADAVGVSHETHPRLLQARPLGLTLLRMRQRCAALGSCTRQTSCAGRATWTLCKWVCTMSL